MFKRVQNDRSKLFFKHTKYKTISKTIQIENIPGAVTLVLAVIINIFYIFS